MPDIRYKRNLPHIHPEGYPLFVTIRLADSLPLEILAELKEQRERELNSRPNISASDRYDIEKRYFGRFDKYLDRCEHGPRWLEREEIARIVMDKILDLDKSRYDLYTCSIMPNHAHLLFDSLVADQSKHKGMSAKYPVTETLRLLKGSTARSCNLSLKRNGRFWHHESYDRFVRDEQELERIIKYILNNPVKAGLVKKWTDWKFTYINPELGSW